MSSQQTSAAAAKSDTSTPQLYTENWATKAALLPHVPGSLDGDFIAAESLGSPLDGIQVQLRIDAKGEDAGLYFQMTFPRAPVKTLESNGFGACHTWADDRPVITDSLPINVRFETKGLKLSVTEIKAGGNIPGRNTPLPAALADKPLTLVEIRPSGKLVQGFGMPFSNPGHPSEDWLLNNKPLVGTTTLMDILQQSAYRFVVPQKLTTVQSNLDLARIPPQVVNTMRPKAPPTNNFGCPTAASNKQAQALARDLVRGAGFYQSLVATCDPNSVPWKLPTVDILDMTDFHYREALLHSVLPEDRERCEKYMQDRPLGLSLVASPAGFGKTEYVSVFTLALATTQGFTYGSAPSDVAVSELADRIDAVDLQVCRLAAKLEAAHVSTDPATSLNLDAAVSCRRKLIIRGFELEFELRALLAILEDPELIANLGDIRALCNIIDSRYWEFGQSLTRVLLQALGHQSVKLLPSDSHKIHKLKKIVDDMPTMASMRQVARGQLSFREYERGATVSDAAIKDLYITILGLADVIATIPSLSAQPEEPYQKIKIEQAKAIAIDDAVAMQRADAYLVHGNTCLPAVYGGDHAQLSCSAAALTLRDNNGHAFNRHGQDAALSMLEFLQGSSMPVLRLRQQLRMAEGLFDLAAMLFYPNLEFTYGGRCNVNLPAFESGRKLENYLQKRWPSIRPAATGTLQPVFLHIPGTTSWRSGTGSRRNVPMSREALNFIVDFVKETDVDPARIVLLTPYTYNLECVNESLKEDSYKILKNVRQTSTVDAFQGQEGDIIVYITVSNGVSGPDIVANFRHMNVAITRQVAGLVVVGDVNVAGRITDEDGNALPPPENKGKDIGKAGSKRKYSELTRELLDKVVFYRADSSPKWTKVTHLRDMLVWFAENQRVIVLNEPVQNS